MSLKLKNKAVLYIFCSLFLVCVYFSLNFSSASAEQDINLIPGSQDPEEVTRDIFYPIINVFNQALEGFEAIIGRILDFIWFKDKIVGFFESVNAWFSKIFGLTLTEFFKEVGELLVQIFNLIVDFGRRLWPVN